MPDRCVGVMTDISILVEVNNADFAHEIINSVCLAGTISRGGSTNAGRDHLYGNCVVVVPRCLDTSASVKREVM